MTLVTDAVALLRGDIELDAPARLILRLRDHDSRVLEEAQKNPGDLRVLLQDPTTGRGEDLGSASLRLGTIGGASAVEFSIVRFGTYLVALERKRA